MDSRLAAEAASAAALLAAEVARSKALQKEAEAARSAAAAAKSAADAMTASLRAELISNQQKISSADKLRADSEVRLRLATSIVSLQFLQLFPTSCLPMPASHYMGGWAGMWCANGAIGLSLIANRCCCK